MPPQRGAGHAECLGGLVFRAMFFEGGQSRAVFVVVLRHFRVSLLSDILGQVPLVDAISLIQHHDRQRGGDDAQDGQTKRRPPMGAERFFVDPEQAMLTNELLKIAYKMSWKLNREGHQAFYFHPFKPEPRFKTAAFYFMPAMYLAGMGQMGLNCSIITPEYGPRIWVTAVLTDKELPAGEPAGPQFLEDCQSCLICVERCPSKSLTGQGWKNVHGCASYGCCGTCLSVCPKG